MHAFKKPFLVIFALGGFAGGCAIMPELPVDWAMPQREIVLHSACEVQSALRAIALSHPPKKVFDPDGWTVKITLNPKVDADIQPGVGLTRRQPASATASRFASWVVGGGNGATLEMRGERTGSLDFDLDSSDLLRDDLGCEHEPFSLHSLTKTIGIESWLVRSVDAAILSHSRLDKPSFSSEVVMKFNGSASYTYNFPTATDLVTMGGFYQLDEILNVNLVAKTPTVRISAITLPSNGKAFASQGSPAPSVTFSTQQTNASLQQILQAIQNSKLNNQ
ncbi:hypothetical protein [Bradyrhizobium diazoefficiens]|uniref:hypothetical protein n=1 Tax=Bradyrhizobium diazoefficiens TaxID=1355477 RepID=UPI00271515BE|nr:hypothetical protein [Bradyrhizobium diazoefficiens]WLC16285.1 hypothetical protein QIH76_40505 [Bradyrhizobium diazoefficiens]